LARIDQLTQEEFVNALVAGVSLTLPGGSRWQPLPESLRRILHGVWPGRIRSGDDRASADEAEAILTAATTEEPLPAWSPAATTAAAPIWKLTDIRIRHFGGVNGATCEDSVEVNVPDNGVIFYGRNGSGKTSLSRAIMWALTGHVIDTDGIDKPANDVVSTYSLEGGTCTSRLPTIVPFPTQDQIADPANIRLPLVALRFEGPHADIRFVKRELIRSRSNFSQTCHWATATNDGQPAEWSPTEDVSAALGIPRQSLENAALQVARLEKLNPSAERNPLAAGIERLSGLTRLGEVSDRLANKLSTYVSGNYSRTLQERANRERENVTAAVQRMNAALERGGLESLPAGDTSKPETSKNYLDEIEAVLAPRRQAADRALSDVLGLAEGQSPPRDARDEWIRARDSIDRIKHQDSLETLLSVWAIPDKLTELNEKVTKISERLKRYEALQQDRLRKVRSALYARIEKWAEDENQPAVDWSNCPVCATDLTDLDDPLLAEPIRQAASQARRDARLLRDDSVRLDAAWSDELANFLAGCPGLDNLELLVRAPELLDIEVLRKRSDLLGLVVRRVVPEPLAALDQPAKPSVVDFPRTRDALATATALAECLREISVKASDVRSKRTTVIAEIDRILREVDEALRSHEPVGTALSELASARKALADWTPIDQKMTLAQSIGPKLSEFGRVREAIDAVVMHTLGALKDRAIGEYYNKLYRAPWLGQPTVRDIEAAQGSKLTIRAAIEDVTGDGARLLNHSHLRAVLLAFAGALKESADGRSGGIDIIVLDDPQVLVDEINRDGLGRWLKALRTARSRPVVFTHSDIFASVVEAKLETPRIRVRPSSVKAYPVVSGAIIIL
jgi:hypothetical protein